MGAFKPCQGKSACRDDDIRCLTCGRELDEIVWLRDLMGQLADLAIEYDYGNIDDYAGYVARKLEETITHRRQELADHARAD